MVTRKICVVTGTRAEYGLLRFVLENLKNSDEVTLQIVATGMHLSPEFGLTVKNIEADGFTVTKRVESLVSSDTPVGIAKSTGLGLIGFADAFADLQPDLIVLLGDRFEILGAAVCALYGRIPVAHLHGGETTEGAFDEGIRHAITKMAHFHFVAAEAYRDRVIQLGEDPERVFHVGGTGVDALEKTTLLDAGELTERLGFDLKGRFLLITYHPVTLEHASSSEQVEELFKALRQLDDEVTFLFTMPNADTDGRVIMQMIESFVEEMKGRAFASLSLGQLNYFSAMKHCAAVVGNSSSGLLEAPSLRVPTVNIGDRQKGRLMAESVISCEPDAASIFQACGRAMSSEFKLILEGTKSPYGEGGASDRITEILLNVDLDPVLLKKRFYDLPLRES